ncbi:MAG: MFS transporter [Flavobacteriales bacterium]
MAKERLNFWQIWNMSFGFLGVQYAFGLQQANMSPIYRYLGADESQIPWLWLAGPITGLVVQPIIGAMSDRTWHKRWGRRRPYFIVGALLTSIALILMPFSSELWMAAGLLWLLDGAANVTMEPFRALIADKLPDDQRTLGYSVQSFFVGLGQTLANLMPILLASMGVATVVASGSIEKIPDFVKLSFMFGAVAIILSIAITVITTKENPPTTEIKKRSFKDSIAEILVAFKEMPSEMKQLWWVKFFTWFGLPLMWQYLSLSIAHHCFNATDAVDIGFTDGIKFGNLGLAIFNILCFVFALLLPFLSKFLSSKKIHAFALMLGGIAFISMKFQTETLGYMIAMGVVGISWASIMSMPYVMLSKSVPAERMGVYMGIFNMFIVIPQIVSMIVVPFIYTSILQNDPVNALVLAGVSLILGAIASWRLKF